MLSTAAFNHDYVDDPRDGVEDRGGVAAGIGSGRRANPLTMTRAEVRSEAEKSSRQRPQNEEGDEEEEEEDVFLIKLLMLLLIGCWRQLEID